MYMVYMHGVCLNPIYRSSKSVDCAKVITDQGVVRVVSKLNGGRWLLSIILIRKYKCFIGVTIDYNQFKQNMYAYNNLHIPLY